MFCKFCGTGRIMRMLLFSVVLHAGDLDALSKRSMPLCMRHLHNSLKREHKLKHWGRLQYGLFLKGAGLSMEDALAFFQIEFTKVYYYYYTVYIL